MSRIGKKPVAIPSGVTANIESGVLSVKGPKGTLTLGLSDLVSYTLEDGAIAVQPANGSKAARSHWGMQRTLVSNLVEGVTDGFTKVLEIKGVGYRANAQGNKLSKQNHAPALPEGDPRPVLIDALRFLNQNVTNEWQDLRIDQLLELAVSRWTLRDVAKIQHSQMRCAEL